MLTPGRKIFTLSAGKVKELTITDVSTDRTLTFCSVRFHVARSNERFETTINSADSAYIAAHLESAVFHGTSAVACFSRSKLEALASIGASNA